MPLRTHTHACVQVRYDDQRGPLLLVGLLLAVVVAAYVLIAASSPL
jgi:hypothetical protein